MNELMKKKEGKPLRGEKGDYRVIRSFDVSAGVVSAFILHQWAA